MSITKSIVELMGGTIEVESQVDKGSLFRVELELRILEEAADRQFWEQLDISRILAVGGDAKSREGILELMGNAGVRVDAGATAEEALEALGDGGCQLALLDWEDCGMDAARTLRAGLPESVPILLMAEYDAQGMEETLKLGNTDTLTKPFFASALRIKVQELKSGGAPESDEEHTLEGMRFLAAEDNEINAEILTELLELEGAACEVAENGRLAVERFQSSQRGELDAILMDVQMPVMNGHDAARAIRTLPWEDAKSIPIIAMTANAFAEDEKAALNAGMDAHVPKPLNIEVLKNVIRQLDQRMGGPL